MESAGIARTNVDDDSEVSTRVKSRHGHANCQPSITTHKKEVDQSSEKAVMMCSVEQTDSRKVMEGDLIVFSRQLRIPLEVPLQNRAAKTYAEILEDPLKDKGTVVNRFDISSAMCEESHPPVAYQNLDANSQKARRHGTT